MDGMHDLGGKQGFGRVAYPSRPHDETWEPLVRALSAFALKSHIYNMDEFRHAIERMAPRHYINAPYYERHLTAVATLLVEQDFIAPEELGSHVIGAFPLAGPIGPGRQPAPPQTFAIGDRVRVKNEYVPGRSFRGRRLTKSRASSSRGDRMIAAPPGVEPAIKFDGRNLSPQKKMVRRFYKDMWDHADVGLIPELLHSDFAFRGSLGPVLVRRSQFEDYVRWVTDSLEDYTSDILDLVEENNRVSGKLRFHGTHRKSLFGRPSTGQHVWWYGAPIIVFRDGRIEDLWVLGDIHGLIGRLDHSTSAPPEFNSEYASSQAELRDRDRGLIMSASERPSEAAAAHHQSQLGFATRAIHHAYDPAEHHGVASPDLSHVDIRVADNDAAAALGGKLYAREHNPTTELLEARLANLEGAEAGLVLASGMAAVGALTLSLLSQGDELIVHRTLYSNTTAMTEQGLPRFGITAVPVDLHDPTNLDAAVTSRRRAVYFETPVQPA